MNKPSNYDNVSTGDFTPVAPGGHHMIIKQVKEQQSKTGKDMLVVCVDFAPNDSQPGYMNNLFKADTRPEKKWPHAGVIYIVCTDNSGNCSRNLKAFTTCFEKSNGTQVVWGEGPQFASQFAGKKIGGVFGRVEEEYNGERRIRTLLRWFCEDGKADSAAIPDDRLLPPKQATDIPGGFVAVENDELPF